MNSQVKPGLTFVVAINKRFPVHCKGLIEKMSIREASFDGVLLITPDLLFRDQLGTLIEAKGKNLSGLKFVQTDISVSRPFVLRGMHFQTKSNQGKLVRCVNGEAFHVAVNVRTDSETFGAWIGYIINDIRHEAVYVPPGFANGFFALVGGATIVSEMTEYFDPELDRVFAWNDPFVGIMSGKDRSALPLRDVGGWVPPSDSHRARPVNDPALHELNGVWKGK